MGLHEERETGQGDGHGIREESTIANWVTAVHSILTTAKLELQENVQGETGRNNKERERALKILHAAVQNTTRKWDVFFA